MSGRRESQFRKLKKKRIGLSLFMIIFVTVIAHLLLAVFVVTFFYHLLVQKVEGGYAHVVHLARLYENVAEGTETRVKALLDEEEPYFVLDASGQIIDRNGENTCILAEPVSALLPDEDAVNEEERGIRIYPDKEMRELVILREESLPDSTSGWLKFASQGEAAVKEVLSWEGDTKEIPLWISVPMTQSRQFVGKTTARLFYSDIRNLIIFAVFIAIMIFLVLVIMIINVINNFRHQRKLTEVFFADDLTGAQNRMWMNFKGEQLLKKRKNAGKRFAMLSIVFVNYRNFCVCHSVSEGEEILNRISMTIAGSLRKQEICAHYASASFGVLLRYEAKPDLHLRIEKMLTALEKIDEVHRFPFHVGVDLIEPCVDENGKIVRRREADMEKFYTNASAARATLSDGEESGIVYFDDKLVEEQRWIDTVRERQEGALANGEFIVYYQPKYDPATKALRGAEALVRWDSREFGFISPGRFIPIFEKNGFITKIDHYMIEHVAKDQKAWLDAGYSCVPVSVNVSRAHFIEDDLAEQIRDIVDRAGTPHELIELEVTESAFFDDKKAMINTINRLKGYGFSVSMDDFGSGYSSLNSLKDMPLDVLKLDAEFFRGDGEDGRGRIVVEEAVNLAKKLNMHTVAEGVEIKEQVDFLASLGCDMIQGFYFAKPMPAQDYMKRMDQKNDSNDAGMML